MKKDIPKKKEDILYAARNLFFKDGFKEVTVEAIVEEAVVSKRTFYKYFSNKPELVKVVLFSAFEQAEHMLTKLVEIGENRKLKRAEFLKAFDLKEFSYYFQSDSLPEYSKYIEEEYPDLIKELVLFYKERILPKYTDLISIAQDQKIIRDIGDIEFFIQYSFNSRAALRETMIQNPEMVKRVGTNRMMELFYDYYLNGILRQDP